MGELAYFGQVLLRIRLKDREPGKMAKEASKDSEGPPHEEGCRMARINPGILEGMLGLFCITCKGAHVPCAVRK